MSEGSQVVQIEGPGLLKPGQKIKAPVLSPQLVLDLISQHYPDLKVSETKELTSYDDRNYYFKDENTVNSYVFKVLNSLSSQSTKHIQFEHELMQFLTKRGIRTSEPKVNKGGKTFSKVTIEEGEENVIRVLSFIPGEIFYNVKKTHGLLFRAGQFLGKIVKNLQEYDGTPLCQPYPFLWNLEYFEEISQFMDIIKGEPLKYSIVTEVLKEFREKVLPKYPELERGPMHGDFNEQNIIVKPDPKQPEEASIHGLIDWGDSLFSFYLFDLAIALAYMMLECHKGDLDPFEGGGDFLKGYSEFRVIPQVEMDLLKVCISARLCQSLVYGQYSYSMDTKNEYLLITAQKGWGFLDLLWNGKSQEELTSIWNKE